MHFLVNIENWFNQANVNRLWNLKDILLEIESMRSNSKLSCQKSKHFSLPKMYPKFCTQLLWKPCRQQNPPSSRPAENQPTLKLSNGPWGQLQQLAAAVSSCYQKLRCLQPMASKLEKMLLKIQGMLLSFNFIIVFFSSYPSLFLCMHIYYLCNGLFY